MINDNYENELSGFLFSLLYLTRDADREGLHHTKQALLKTLDSFLEDCSSDPKILKDCRAVIDLCLASMNLYPEELKFIINEIQKISNDNDMRSA